MKTAVEQLERQILDNWMDILRGKVHIGDLFEQAKEMEKEQIMRTARQCYFEGVRKRTKTTEELIEYAEQYYNETFKQNK
jgi:hypothetical protein